MRHGSIVAIVIGSNKRRDELQSAGNPVRSLPRKGKTPEPQICHGRKCSEHALREVQFIVPYCRLGTSFLTVSIMAGVVE